MKTYKCKKCGLKLPLSSYVYKNRKLGLRHVVCKTCQRAYKLKHYYANRAYYIARARKRSLEVLFKLYAVLDTYAHERGCLRCGESDPAVLQFHHRDNRSKSFSIKAAVAQGIAPRIILAELKKCNVLCANCHMREHGHIRQHEVKT